MPSKPPMPASQRVVQVCLFLVAAIAVFGGTLQMYLVIAAAHLATHRHASHASAA